MWRHWPGTLHLPIENRDMPVYPNVTWLHVPDLNDWVHMFLGYARMREAIEKHHWSGYTVGIFLFPIGQTKCAALPKLSKTINAR